MLGLTRSQQRLRELGRSAVIKDLQLSIWPEDGAALKASFRLKRQPRVEQGNCNPSKSAKQQEKVMSPRPDTIPGLPKRQAFPSCLTPSGLA